MERKEKYTKSEIAELIKGAPSKGNVEIRLKDPKRTGTITLRDYILELEDGAVDYRPFIDSNGNHRIAKYKGKKVLRMTNENDRLEYVHLKNHPKYTNGSNQVLLIYNHEEEADNYVALKDAEAEANAKIKTFTGQKLRNLARVCQITVRPGSSETVLKRALYEYADRDLSQGGIKRTGAVDILEQLNSPEYEDKVLLYNAMDKKMVEVKNGRYLFGQIGLGTTFDTALQFLIDNPDISSELSKKLQFKDTE
jgi:hypothetical protein